MSPSTYIQHVTLQTGHGQTRLLCEKHARSHPPRRERAA